MGVLFQIRYLGKPHGFFLGGKLALPFKYTYMLLRGHRLDASLEND